MPQNKVIDRIDAQDTFEELKKAQILLDSITMVFHQSPNDEKLEKMYYLLSIYQEKMMDILPRLDGILSCQN